MVPLQIVPTWSGWSSRDAPKMGARVFDGTPEDWSYYPMGSSGYEEAVFSYSAQPFFLVQYLDTASDGGQVPKDDGRYKEGDEVVAQGNIGNLTKEGIPYRMEG